MLPNALFASGQNSLPPFAEYIVLDSLFSHCMLLQRLARVAPLSGSKSRKFWAKHAWLSSIAEKRSRVLEQTYPCELEQMSDPMVTFGHALARFMQMYLSCSGPPKSWSAGEKELASGECDDRITQSLQKLAQMVKLLPRASCFKVGEKRVRRKSPCGGNPFGDAY